MRKPFDLLIVGGGPVGWACALAATRASEQMRHPLSIALVDASPPRAVPTGLFEPRVYTVTEENLAWCRDSRVAFDAARLCDVSEICVFDQQGSQALNVSARDARRPRLASVIEHDTLTHALAARAEKAGVEFVEASIGESGVLDQDRYVETSRGALLNAKLVIVAEGARSKLRAALQIATVERDYERFGVVAHFSVRAPHLGQARQWFLPDRTILALLPLPDVDGAPAVSMVWSCSPEQAERLKLLTAAALCEAVSVASRNQVNIDRALSSPQAFPLRLLRASDPVAERAILVGDAAHAVHPLAGQGVNLGLGDAIGLQAALASSSAVGFDVGHPLVTTKFRRLRYTAVLAMQTATDGLARLYNLDQSLFAMQPTALATVADAGMRVLGRLPAFRRALSSAAS
ncbi:MAG: hypothetical protein EAZ24_13645 [Burkholderiales bacterium]|nr:MAG: hypothetical protein EAZ24_13645 [Burkholderiales bacterium]TAG82334.1 MAG: hypothetical protein EAZ21_03865 [Betaproteobacteria bacterium]